MNNTPFSYMIENDQPEADQRFYIEVGFANGYLALPPDHPAHGYNPLDYECQSDNPYDELSRLGVNYGKLAKHACMSSASVPAATGGLLLLSDIELTVPDDWWILGFDTRHLGQNLTTHPLEKCWGETIQLAVVVAMLTKRVHHMMDQDQKDRLAQVKAAKELMALVDQALPHKRKDFEVFLGIIPN